VRIHNTNKYWSGVTMESDRVLRSTLPGEMKSSQTIWRHGEVKGQIKMAEPKIDTRANTMKR
jgi:hypothetical protein